MEFFCKSYLPIAFLHSSTWKDIAYQGIYSTEKNILFNWLVLLLWTYESIVINLLNMTLSNSDEETGISPSLYVLVISQ